jgi:hypothetical protein
VTLIETADGGSGSVPEYDPDTNTTPPAKAYVGGNRIPLVNRGAKVEWRKQGPMSVQGVADLYFPNVGPDGKDWLTPLSGRLFEPCDVELYDPDADEHQLAFRGMVQSLGSGTTTDNEMRLRVVDMGLLLGSIDASRTFNNVTLGSVLAYIASRLEDAFPTLNVQPLVVGDQVNLVDEDLTEQSQRPFSPPVVYPLTAFYEDHFGDDPRQPDYYDAGDGDFSGTYQANRHSLADVLADASEYTDHLIRFGLPQEPTTNRFQFNLTTIPLDERNVIDVTATDAVRALDNNLLADINPVNTLVLKGAQRVVVDDEADEKSQSLFETFMETATVADVAPRKKKYYEVTAQHEPTVDVAGTAVSATATSDASSLDALETEAKNRLKEMLGSGGIGNALLTLTPGALPYDVVRMPLNCRSDITFRYEIESLTHHAGVRQSEDRQAVSGVPKTEFTASLAAEYDEIEITDVKNTDV